MKKYIEIEEEVLVRLINGERVEGALRRDQWTSVLTFKAYRRSPHHKVRDKVIRHLEHGWVKESPRRIKVYESIPKDLGTARMIGVLERETKEAKNALIDRELIESV